MHEESNERASRKEMILGVIFVAIMIALAIYSIVIRGLNPIDTPRTLVEEVRDMRQNSK
jgi:hypothetical protein